WIVGHAGRGWVRRDVLPAVVVHNGEGPSLLGHVQPPLHRRHHRARHRHPPRTATHRKLVGCIRRRRRAVHCAVGQSRGRQDPAGGGARRRSGEDMVGLAAPRRGKYDHRAAPSGRQPDREVARGSTILEWPVVFPSSWSHVFL
uniref:Uncharacterized protein n=1 Tax=Aegilops tauschii subsp. strangulata TaxID=200361 RepID=A0A453KW91_AEGTS